MDNLNAKKVNRLIEEFSEKGKKPEKLEIGYKTYARLVDDEKFYDKVTKSSDSKERLYKGIKIKLVAEKHYFQII